MTRTEAKRYAERCADIAQKSLWIVEHRAGEWSLAVKPPIGLVRFVQIDPRDPSQAMQQGSTWHGRNNHYR